MPQQQKEKTHKKKPEPKYVIFFLSKKRLQTSWIKNIYIYLNIGISKVFHYPEYFDKSKYEMKEISTKKHSCIKSAASSRGRTHIIQI